LEFIYFFFRLNIRKQEELRTLLHLIMGLYGKMGSLYKDLQMAFVPLKLRMLFFHLGLFVVCVH